MKGVSMAHEVDSAPQEGVGLSHMLLGGVAGVVRANLQNFSMKEFAFFLIIYEEPMTALTVGEIARKLDISVAAARHAFANLVACGFADRVVNPVDNRSVLAGRTVDGQNFYSDLKASLS